MLYIFGTVTERRKRHIAELCSSGSGDEAFSPLPVQGIKIVRKGFGRPSEPDAPGFGGSNTFSLSLANTAAFIFRYKRQNLKNNVAEKGSHQIFSPAGIQKRHIKNNNINSFFSGENSPLFQNICVVTAKTVNALNKKQIVFFLFSQKFFVLRTIEIFSGLFVGIDVLRLDMQFSHYKKLPVFVLILRADTNVSISFLHVFSPSLFLSAAVHSAESRL